jgi:large subunit ribosomal protein L18
MKLETKKKLLQNRRWRIRKRVQGTAARPRLTLYLSNKHIYAQCIDDDAAVTLVAVSSMSKELKGENLRPTVAGATALGAKVAEAAKAKGIDAVVFDRNGRLYHGAVKAFADAARSGGLSF